MFILNTRTFNPWEFGWYDFDKCWGIVNCFGVVVSLSNPDDPYNPGYKG